MEKWKPLRASHFSTPPTATRYQLNSPRYTNNETGTKDRADQEEYDSGAKRVVGNFPQALSHIALVHAAFAMSGAWTPHRSDEGTVAKIPHKTKSAAVATVARGTTKGLSRRS